MTTAKQEANQNEGTANAPVFSTRIGSISGKVWKNAADGNRVYYNVEITHNYRDKDENWKSTHSYSHDNLLNVAKVAERTEEYISKLQIK